MSEGHLARHVRKMRQVYGRRRRLLLDALQADFGAQLQAIPSEAGLHLAALAPRSGTDLQPLVQKAAQHGISLNALSRYGTGNQPPQAGLVFGYGAIGEAAIPQAMGLLRRLWK